MEVSDLIGKVLGILAGILGLAGYVLVLGAAILWLRLHQVELPPEVPISIADREELIAIGAQAVAVWVLLVVPLGGLAAWIVTGDPGQRKFGYREAGLAIAITLSTLLALNDTDTLLLTLPVTALIVAAVGALVVWPSVEAVAAALLPAGVGFGLAFSLSLFTNSNGIATAAGAVFIFGSLALLTPWLQRWRHRQGKNRHALAQIEVQAKREDAPEIDPRLLTALKSGPAPDRPSSVVWIGRIAVASLALLVLGVIAVTSQVDRDTDFHRVLVSLSNGDCLEGTYIARGGSEIVIAQPEGNGADERTRIATIPVKEVLEVQVYGQPVDGVPLARDDDCAGNEDALVR